MHHERVYFFTVKPRSLEMRVKSNLLARSSKYFLSSNSVSESCAAPRGANLGKPRFSEGRFFCVPTDLAL